MSFGSYNGGINPPYSAPFGLRRNSRNGGDGRGGLLNYGITSYERSDPMNYDPTSYGRDSRGASANNRGGRGRGRGRSNSHSRRPDSGRRHSNGHRRQVHESDSDGHQRGSSSRGGRGHSHPPHRGGHSHPAQRSRGGANRVSDADRRDKQYWEKLEIVELARQSTASKVLDKVQNEEESFMNALKFKKFLKEKGILKCLIKILHSIVIAADQDATGLVGRIVSRVIENCADFVSELQSFIQFDLNPDDQSLEYLLAIASFSLQRVHASTIKIFPHADLQLVLNRLQVSGQLPYNICHLYEKYTEEYAIKLQEMRQQSQQSTSAARVSRNYFDIFNHDNPPPNDHDYKDCSILPESKEINNPKFKPFLRTNLIREDYKNPSHYLDVQFRLLREDFIGPLRDGIESLQDPDTKPDVTVYKGVRILEPICLYSGLGFQIQFDLTESRLQRVNWEHSRRLIYGSLICLTNDNFQSIIFGTIEKRDVDELKVGRLTVKFEGEASHRAAFNSKPADRYIMIESSAYFEAYRHVLECLQQIIPDQMPFQPYLVANCPRQIPSPIYLQQSSVFNLRNVLKFQRSSYHHYNTINVKDKFSWPSFHETELDKSQLEALRMALSQELSIIQGPPGTGKTFIGLKIVQALLENRRVWDPSENSPILVICYTNHALDQFLEGIVNTSINESPPKVVRIGGRCKSDQLRPLVLANRVKEMRKHRLFSARLAGSLKKTRVRMGENQDIFEETLGNLDLMDGRMLSLEDLHKAHIISDTHYRQLIRLSLGSRESAIEVWLKLISPDDLPSVLIQRDSDLEITQLSQDSDENIDVLDEPQLMEEDRREEGEEYEFMTESLKKREERNKKRRKQQKTTKPHVSAQDDGGWKVVKKSAKKRKQEIAEFMKLPPMSNEKVLRVRDITLLSHQDRWKLYLNWINEFIVMSKEDLREIAEEYDSSAKECKDLNEDINFEAMGDIDVVGMTTTGAAKHSYMLGKLSPRIVVVEEAAEVMEAHILTSLCPSTQQLILIGDHKQLQPKPAHYDLEYHYNFNISLFERLIKRGVPHVTLSTQHRMRPNIASIVGTHIYDDKLSNADNVHLYPPVKGINKNLFFIEHKHREKGDDSNDSRSRSNIFEADYITSLTSYLLKQGYKPGQITILTMYRGQLIAIKQKMTKKTFGGVKVAAVDDFQGEENDIIILSLVRSNSRQSIGFLKIENRVCVALSRAKHGMYVIGDFSMLRRRSETKWPGIIAEMEEKGFLGDGLELQCQNHSEKTILAKTPEDFSKVPAGGCMRRCGRRLSCGHVCESMCHPDDLEHETTYKCTKACGKTLPCGHPCSQRCCECKKKGCGSCKKKMTKILPCGHKTNVPCNKDPSTVECKEPCTKTLSCGHKCTNRCSEKCVSVYHCKQPCDVKLKCDHRCKGTCGTCFRGRLHTSCSYNCNKILECGHICKFPCLPDCPPCEEKCSNYCFHGKCTRKCYEPCVPCCEPCKWECKHHKCTATCGEMCIRPPCNMPCRKILKKCGHPCIGLCGEDCPKLCRICDKDEVTEIFFGSEDEDDARFIQLKDCKHIFEVTGLDQWMKKGDRAAVQFRECPKCKTPIRRSLRYGNIVKAAINEMEEVKQEKLRGNMVKKYGLLSEVQSLIHQISSLSNDQDSSDLETLLNGIKEILKTNESRHHILSTIQNKLRFIPMLIETIKLLSQIPFHQRAFTMLGVTKASLCEDVRRIVQFLDTPFLSSQQVEDFQAETLRINCIALIFQFNASLAYVNDKDTQDMESFLKLLLKMGETGEPRPSEQMRQIVETNIRQWKAKYDLYNL